MGSSNSLSPDLARNVLRNLSRHLERYFTKPNGELKAQRLIAEEMKIAQPVLNQLLAQIRVMNGEGERKRDPSLGVNTVIKLRHAMKMPLDELLGLPPLPDQEPRTIILRALDRLADEAKKPAESG